MKFNLKNKIDWLTLGKRGESFVCKYLEKNGYLIWHRNWRCRQGEIDIIATKDSVLAFLEVRTRVYKNESDIRARDSIGIEKQRKLISLIDIYLNRYELKIEQSGIISIRRDVVGVEYRPGKEVIIDHIEDAF